MWTSYIHSIHSFLHLIFSIRHPPLEAPMIDYPARLKQARDRMADQGIGLMFLMAGANLFYLTGVRRHEEGGTDHNAYGDWVVGGYIGAGDGVVLTAPRM